MTHLDLFSGIGGFALAARWLGIETIGFCELDGFCDRVLEKNFPGIPNYGDIKKADFRGVAADLITGGYPCQPVSLAGKRAGTADDRWLWPAMLEVIKIVRPTWVVCENVAGHLSMGVDEVCVDLASQGYEVGPPFVLPACAKDALHRRDRVWIIAHSEHDARCSEQQHFERKRKTQKKKNQSVFKGSGPALANSNSLNGYYSGYGAGAIFGERPKPPQISKCFIPNRVSSGLEERKIQSTREKCSPLERSDKLGDWWSPEPSVGRMAYGVPNRVDRLRGLGNAIVPQIAFEIFKGILNAHD